MAPATAPSDAILPHIESLYKASECRTPLICCKQNGDPYKSIAELAKQAGVSVWKVVTDTPKTEQNALDYLEVGLQNGDWLYMQGAETASATVLRTIGKDLYTVVPDPKNYPKRELFRMWIVVEQMFDLDDNVLFPKVLLQNALLGWKDNNVEGVIVSAKQKADPGVLEEEERLKAARMERTQDEACAEDAEMEDPNMKPTGMWFHRSVDFYSADAGNAVTKSAEDIFDCIEKGEMDRVSDIVTSNLLDVNNVFKGGLTPLFWAIMCDNKEMVRLFLEHGHANPEQRRQGNGMPPIFMSLEDPEILQLLLDFGADIDARYEGKSLMDHPDTSPQIRDYIKENLL